MNPDKYWYSSKNPTGWRKTQPQTTRLRCLLESTLSSGAMTMHERYLIAARRAQALSDVTTDLETKRLAAEDAAVFSTRARAIARAKEA